MSLGFSDDSQTIAQGVMGSLQCGNPDCRKVVARAHLMGLGLFQVLDCPDCHRGTEYENTPRGWTVKLLPKRNATVAPKAAPIPKR